MKNKPDITKTETQYFDKMSNDLSSVIEKSKQKYNWVQIVTVIMAIIVAVIAIRNLVKDDIGVSKKQTEREIKQMREDIKEDIKDIKQDIKEVKDDVKDVKMQISKMSKEIKDDNELVLMIKDISRTEFSNFLKNKRP